MSGTSLEKRRRAAGLMRDLSRELLTADLDLEDLDRVIAGLSRLNESVAAAPRLVRNERRLLVRQSGEELDEESSWDGDPLVGFSNPVAPPLIREDGPAGEWKVTFGTAYEGHPGLVHGGFVAASLDHVLGVTASTSEGTSMTGTLTVRYRRPTPAHVELVCRGRVDRVEGRKVFCRAELRHGGTVLAEADGVFFRVDSIPSRQPKVRVHGDS